MTNFNLSLLGYCFCLSLNILLWCGHVESSVSGGISFMPRVPVGSVWYVNYLQVFSTLLMEEVGALT